VDGSSRLSTFAVTTAARGWSGVAGFPERVRRSGRPTATSTSPSAAGMARRGRRIELRSWPGMVGHNWGSEHAERWIWVHGIGFEGAPGSWLDVVLGRVLIAGRLTPWVANGALSLDGRRHRLGGLAARGLEVSENAGGCALTLPGEHGLTVQARVVVPPNAAAGWRYSDPRGGAHDVVNCSIAAISISVSLAGRAATSARTLQSAHGGAYELGMRERDHGVPLAPFEDD